MESKFIIIFNIFLLIQLLSIAAGLTFEQLKTCQQYKTNTGEYTDFFKISNIMDKQLPKNEMINLRFYVITSRDAHIGLHKQDILGPDFTYYEIVLGAGENTYSVIRHQPSEGVFAMTDGSVDLDTFIPISIRVIQTKEGRFKVYISNKEYMSFTDQHPKSLRFVSFKSHANEPAVWFYNCQFEE